MLTHLPSKTGARLLEMGQTSPKGKGLPMIDGPSHMIISSRSSVIMSGKQFKVPYSHGVEDGDAESSFHKRILLFSSPPKVPSSSSGRLLAFHLCVATEIFVM